MSTIATPPLPLAAAPAPGPAAAPLPETVLLTVTMTEALFATMMENLKKNANLQKDGSYTVYDFRIVPFAAERILQFRDRLPHVLAKPHDPRAFLGNALFVTEYEVVGDHVAKK